MYSVFAGLPVIIFMEIEMNLSADDKKLLVASLETESAKTKRAMNAASNQSIKEILGAQLANIHSLAGRVHNEPVVKEGK